MSDPVDAVMLEALRDYVQGNASPATARRLVAAVRPLIEAEVRAQIADEIESSYLGPDFGRSFDGRESPDAQLHDAYDQGLERAAAIVRGE